MFQVLSPRLARFGLVAASALALLGGAGSSERVLAADRDWPARVTASYKVAFNGFDIGRFSFDAEVRSGRYVLDGNAEISALLGAFKWQGLSRASGAVASQGAEPAAYTFDFRSSSKSGAVKVAFKKGSVQTVSTSPPSPPSEEIVPVEPRHLTDVLDPLSAVLALTRAGAGDPCRQRLPVFDGKQRFDLVMSPMGERQLVEKRPSGQPGTLIICQMRYQPIAGYKRGAETEDLARTMKIEIALRPVPSANLMVPHEIKIPTLVGSAVLSLDRMEIMTSNSDQIAFVN